MKAEEYIEILRENCSNYLKLNDYFNNDESEEFSDLLPDYLFNDENISTDCGATKFVIIPKYEDYVIKIPFNSIYSDEHCSYFDEENDDYCYDEGYFYFEEANNPDNDWDYCEVETRIVKAAKEEGLLECFAISEKIGDVNGYPIYKQEKATGYGYTTKTPVSEAESEEISKKKNSSKYYRYLPLAWMKDFIEFFGDEMFIKFLDFLAEYDINDLSGTNVGYINGRPVLIDYSGYNENM